MNVLNPNTIMPCFYLQKRFLVQFLDKYVKIIFNNIFITKSFVSKWSKGGRGPLIVKTQGKGGIHMFICSIDRDVYLKLLTREDAERLFALVDSCRPHLRRWLPWVDAVKAVEDSRAFIEGTLKKFAAGNGFEAGIWYKGELAGVIGLHYIDRNNRKTSIGYWLGEPFQGLGLMTKSCKACIDYVFQELKLNRVEIRCAVENQKSRAIPERLGFVNEGTIREAEWLYDHFVDHIVYGMIASEWRAR